MEIISYTAMRARLAEKMSQVCVDHTPIVITRSNEKPVVLISLEDYEAMEETNYLLSSPANAARLADAVDEIEALIVKNKKSKTKPRHK